MTRTRQLTALLLIVAVVVVVEGFALSWGGSSATSSPITTSTIASPDVAICAKGTHYRFMQVDYLRDNGGDELAAVTGHVVRLHCGGPDDFQYLVQRIPETVSLAKHATITLMNLEPSYFTGNLAALNSYLAQDQDGNIFLITGPSSGATALTSMFHP